MEEFQLGLKPMICPLSGSVRSRPMGTCQSKCVLQQFSFSFFSQLRFLWFRCPFGNPYRWCGWNTLLFSLFYLENLWAIYLLSAPLPPPPPQATTTTINLVFFFLIIFVVYFWGLMWRTATEIQHLLLYGNPWQLPRSLLWSMGFFARWPREVGAIWD